MRVHFVVSIRISYVGRSAKTGDAILGVQIPPTAAKLRRLMNWGQIVQSHALSFFHLSGPDLLLGSAEFFIKQAHSDKQVSWHQDLTYWGLREPEAEITAWVALSESSVESGCMRFLPGSHQRLVIPVIRRCYPRDTHDRGQLSHAKINKIHTGANPRRRGRRRRIAVTKYVCSGL